MNKTNIEHPTSNAERRTWGDAALRMTNDEFPMTKEFLIPNEEGKAGELAGTIWTFVLRHSFGIRHSDFVIVQSQRSNAEGGVRNQATDNGPLTTDHRQPTTNNLQPTTNHEPLTRNIIYDQTAKP